MLRCASLVLFALPLAQSACSPAENKCGELCCCVTCTCLEDPYRCEDMWGKPTDHVGTQSDERWSDPAWLENHHREQMAIAEEHRRQHQERMREMEANMPQEQRERRERMARRRMERRRSRDSDDFDEDEDMMMPPDLEEMMGRDGRGRTGPDDADKMRRRMEKRMQDAMKKHHRRRRASDPSEDEEDEPEEDDEPRRPRSSSGKFKKGWEWEDEEEARRDPRDL